VASFYSTTPVKHVIPFCSFSRAASAFRKEFELEIRVHFGRSKSAKSSLDGAVKSV
jgi:hypothetical protein